MLHLHVLEVPDDLALRPHHEAALVRDELALETTVHSEEPGELQLTLHSEGLSHHRLRLLQRRRAPEERAKESEEQQEKVRYHQRGGDK